MWKTSSTTMEILIMLTRLSVAASLSVFCTAACFSQLAFSDITVTAGTGGPIAKDDLGGHGVMFADMDKDGLADLYITMIFDKPMPDLFFRNLEARSNYSYLGQDDPVLHFGLGPYESVDIVIVFLDGSEAAATDIPANQTLVVEGSSIKHKKADRIPGT